MNSTEPGSRTGSRSGPVQVEMQLIDGTDLATLLHRSGPLSPPRAVAIVRRIAAALDAAHAAGGTHRDVKPENILVTDDDFASLVDFGIARAADLEPAPAEGGEWLAPEQLTGGEVTQLADVYALACVLTECLTGSPPDPGAPPPQPSRLRPGRIPAALDAVIARGLARQPDDRYPSAGDLALAAHQALTGPERNQASRILRRGAGPSRQVVAEDTAGPGPTAPPLPINPARALALSLPPPSAPVPSRFRLTGKPVLLAAAAALVAVAATAAGNLIAQPSQASPVAAPRQTVLASTGLDFRLSPGGVALDSGGNVYVTSQGMYGRVVKLTAGSGTPTVLPFSDLYRPRGVAVDTGGAVYFADADDRVVKLDTGSNIHTVLPFVGLDDPAGVAVDSGGDVYVADRGNDQVVKLAAGSSDQSVLPFAGLNNPNGVAVDGAGNVYVTDTANNRVVKLAAGSDTQTVLPFAGIAVPRGIAVDGAGGVYVTEQHRNKVVRLAAGSAIPTVLPFVGLNAPLDVAVDALGDVYVADRGNDRVVRLRAGAG